MCCLPGSSSICQLLLSKQKLQLHQPLLHMSDAKTGRLASSNQRQLRTPRAPLRMSGWGSKVSSDRPASRGNQK